MEAEKLHLKLNLLTFCRLLSYVVSANVTVPFHGCYWDFSCQNTHLGDCGKGSIFGRSKDCNGLCPEPEHPLCPPPYFTRFYCCILEHPKIMTAGCSKCENKVDTGYEYLCCSDCSDPHTEYGDTKLGYCESGAEIIAETKPKELFKWVTGPWKPCSSTCDGGIRYRDVDCYVVFADTLLPDYPVYDHKCSIEAMPAREEPCNASCIHVMQRWILMTLAILVIGLASYALYRRRTSMQYGQVYITMEAYP